MAWSAGARLGEDGLYLIGRLLLARLLGPEAFGTFALAMGVIVGVQLCCQLQLGAAVIQRSNLSPGMRGTAFWSVGALGLVGCVFSFVVAPGAGALLGDPRLAPVLRVLSLSVLLSGCSAVPRAWLSREFGFRQLAALDVLVEVFSTITALVAALLGAGVYALAAHALVGAAVETGAVWTLIRWRPPLHWRYHEFAELFRFGWPLIWRRIFDYVTAFGDQFLVGYVFGPAALGIYVLALRLARWGTRNVGLVFERVAFPLFARSQGDLERGRRAVLGAVRAQALVTFPLAVGLALVAPELVAVSVGSVWAGSVPLVRILCARGAAGCLIVLPRLALTGLGRQWLVFRLGLTSAAMFVLGCLAGQPWGTTGIAVGGTVATLVFAFLSVWSLRQDMAIAAREWLVALLPAAAGTASMWIGVALVDHLLAAGAGAGRRLGLLVVAGALCYVLPLSPWLAREAGGYLRQPAGDAPDPTLGRRPDDE
jgi:O-antigen/teichoic acid export membrane protein